MKSLPGTLHIASPNTRTISLELCGAIGRSDIMKVGLSFDKPGLAGCQSSAKAKGERNPKKPIPELLLAYNRLIGQIYEKPLLSIGFYHVCALILSRILGR